MGFDTRFCELVGCRLPIQLASLGGPVGSPQLAAAVSEAGGLGMIPNPSVDEVDVLVSIARGLTTRPIGIGFLVPFVDREAVEAAAAQADVVEFFYGDPDVELIRLAKRHRAVAGWQVGSAREAEAAIEAGCDYVAAQGVEAGGHVRGTQSLDDVLEATLHVVSAPVVAAGGIGSPDRVAQVLSNGASAVRIGTRFAAATESNAHPEYIDMLIQAQAADTTLTEAFGVGWPNAPHRVLRSAIDAANSFDRDVVAIVGERQLPPFAPVPPTRQAEGAILAMALYAGLSVDHVTRPQSAAEIMNELTSGLP